MSIRAGQLRHRLEVQEATEVQDAHGQATKTWVKVKSRKVEIKPLAGAELFNAQQVQARVSHEITLRYYADLTPEHRFRLATRLRGERIFNILSVRHTDEMNVDTVCACEEMV